jgi:hypothetical protein
MKKQIEQYGTLTSGMYDTIYFMMLPIAELADGQKVDLDVKIIRVKKQISNFGYYPTTTFTLYCETELNEGVKIYFSSINAKTNELLLDLGVYDVNGDVYIGLMEHNICFNVKGTYDGYKIKRAKLSKLS